jgi:hypothetical protein
MSNVLTNRGWLAAFAAAILCLVAFVGVSNVLAAGSVSDFKVGSATTPPNADVTINVTASGSAIGAFGVNIKYDTTLVTPTSCTSPKGACNVTFASDTVRINGADNSGISGTDVVLGTITFHAGSTTGTANLTPTITTLTDTDLNALTVTPSGGQIVIAAETATPSAAPTSPAASASATNTPASLPQTGGSPDSGSSLMWLLAAAGLVVVAAGAWTVSRARKTNS